MKRSLLMLVLVCGGAVAQEQEAELPPLPAPLPITRETRYAPSAVNLREYHDLLASEPHVAGTPGDLRVVEKLFDLFTQMQLSVEKHEFWAYLPRPIINKVELVAPEAMTLELREKTLPEDPVTADPAIPTGWNAYSGDGDVTAGVVYVNYGTRADFEKLKSMGVDLKGKIALARYGGNFRGYKAKFAQEAGAAGLLIYTDPADSGFAKGEEYPKGGYLNDTCIERGSLLTLPYAGDPLTPGVEASEHAQRKSPADVALPKIPVQPIGWAAAREIMKRMTGPELPEELTGEKGSWRGKMPVAYRLEGGPELKVRVHVLQERKLTRCFNVIAILPGREEPDRGVVIGCHLDAWGCGASDAMSGMISLLEVARVSSELARADQPLRRSLVFCAWGAEEFGIIGSTEWVEAQVDLLQQATIAYLNLDMASMGPQFGAAAAPTLRTVITEAAQTVPQPRATDGSTVFTDWISRGKDPLFRASPTFGDIGGGSDHVAFWCYAGIPSAGLSGGGSKGTAYHTAYDTLAWYRKVVGEDYAPAKMIAQMTLAVARRLAGDPVAPIDIGRLGPETRRQLQALTDRGRAIGFFAPGEDPVAAELGDVLEAAERFGTRGRLLDQRLRAMSRKIQSSGQEPESLRRINELLMRADRAWLSDKGVPAGGEGKPDRPWYRNLMAATDEDSGYGSWPLPALRAAIERRDEAMLLTQRRRYLNVFTNLEVIARELEELVGAFEASQPGAAPEQPGR
jgi:N-acetylated-alpha-linked acidic dipeptidase